MNAVAVVVPVLVHVKIRIAARDTATSFLHVQSRDFTRVSSPYVYKIISDRSSSSHENADRHASGCVALGHLGRGGTPPKRTATLERRVRSVGSAGLKISR